MKKITILLLSLMCLKMSAQITTRSPVLPNLQFGSHEYQHFQCETLAR